MSIMNARDIIRSRERTKKDHIQKFYWNFKYEELLKCYGKLQEQLQEVSKKSKLLEAIKIGQEPDSRSVKIPETTNGWYGLLVNDDFKYISDAYVRPPLPKEYQMSFQYDYN